MQFNSVAEFIAMDGHGLYVWLSYGFAFVILALLVFASQRQAKHVRQNIMSRMKRENKLRQAAQMQAEQESPNES